ncbi:MAG: hypothetical protein GY786_12825, partial [Proteobacteria bacterium]|nr:hypothetical protein [Pseudomonadota bacterium]
MKRHLTRLGIFLSYLLLITLSSCHLFSGLNELNCETEFPVTIMPGECVKLQPLCSADWERGDALTLDGTYPGLSLSITGDPRSGVLCSAADTPLMVNEIVDFTYINPDGEKGSGSLSVSTNSVAVSYSRIDEEKYQLESRVTHLNEPLTYSWAEEPDLSSLSAINIADPVASPSVPTTYTLTVTDSSGDTPPMSRSITIDPAAVQHALRVAVKKEGTVSSFPSGIDCPDGECTSTYNKGQIVKLLAEPDDGHYFYNWETTGYKNCRGTVPEIDIDLNNYSAGVCKAVFREAIYRMSIDIIGEGDVSSDPGGLICVDGTCSGIFKNYEPLTLTPDPSMDYKFAHWSGGRHCDNEWLSIQNPLTFSDAGFSDEHCTVTFQEVAPLQRTLNIVISGTARFTDVLGGPPRVQSSPYGIDCSDPTCD